MACRRDAGAPDTDRSRLDLACIAYYASPMETIKGGPVTESDVEQWADEADQG